MRELPVVVWQWPLRLWLLTSWLPPLHFDSLLACCPCCAIHCEWFRKSFHGFPPGNAVLLDSPDSFIVTPMQIDTVRQVQCGLLSCIFW